MGKSPDKNFKLEFEIAKKAAVTAGTHILRVGRDRIIDERGRDIKHRADLESEKIIVDMLDEATDYPLLTEEGGELGDIDQCPYFWIIDPLDGTLNFSKGIDFSCVSISLWHGNKPIFGVVNDFNRKELFSGLVGIGAWCNDRVMTASQVKEKQHAVLATGFPVNRDFSSDAIGSFIYQVHRFKKVRLLGSAALSLCYLSCGRVDAYAEENIMFWDVAAGIAIVESATGFISFQNSKDKRWAKNVWAGEVFRYDHGGKTK